MTSVAKWDFFELELSGPSNGNPYLEVSLEGTFTQRGRAYWAAFARHGRPETKDLPRWPADTIEERPTMWLDAEPKVALDPDREERLFWENHKEAK